MTPRPTHAPIIDLDEARAKRDAAEASELVGLLEASVDYHDAKRKVAELFGAMRQVDHEIELMGKARREGTVEDAREAERRVQIATRRLARALGKPLETDTTAEGDKRHG